MIFKPTPCFEAAVIDNDCHISDVLPLLLGSTCEMSCARALRTYAHPACRDT